MKKSQKLKHGRVGEGKCEGEPLKRKGCETFIESSSSGVLRFEGQVLKPDGESEHRMVEV